MRKIKKILNVYETKKDGFTEVLVKTIKPFKSEVKVYVKDGKIHTSPNFNGSEFNIYPEGLRSSIKDALFAIIADSMVEHNKVYGTLKRTSDITDGQLLLEPEDDPEKMIGKTVKIVATDDNFPSDIIVTHPTIKGQYVVDLDDIEYTDEAKPFKQAVLHWDIESDQATPADEFEIPVEFEEESK